MSILQTKSQLGSSVMITSPISMLRISPIIPRYADRGFIAGLPSLPCPGRWGPVTIGPPEGSGSASHLPMADCTPSLLILSHRLISPRYSYSTSSSISQSFPESSCKSPNLSLGLQRLSVAYCVPQCPSLQQVPTVSHRPSSSLPGSPAGSSLSSRAVFAVPPPHRACSACSHLPPLPPPPTAAQWTKPPTVGAANRSGPAPPPLDRSAAAAADRGQCMDADR